MENDASQKDKIEKQVFNIISDFLKELKAERAQQAIASDALLEQDLGIGSLEKAELLTRIEKAFAISLPVAVMADAQSIGDLIAIIHRANPAISVSMWKKARRPLEPLELYPSQATTLIQAVLHYAEKRPERPHIYLQDEQGVEQIITYGKLVDKAINLANGLIARGLKPDDTVAIMLPTSENFFYIFFAILFAGGIPVPIYPPYRPDRIEEYIKREANILRNAETRFLITFHQAEALSRILKTFIPSLKGVYTVESFETNLSTLPDTVFEEKHAALIQYTSGSTGDPKGVLLTHQNLLANIHSVGKAGKVQPNDVVVSWLPLYHDMGLIGTWFCSLYYGLPVAIMSPMIFLTRPERWLWAIHYHRGTLSAGPNFSYELCIRKIDQRNLEGLDLSCWRLAFNGAEAIYPRTLKNFAKKFAPFGFKPESFFPVYGLAECSVALTFPAIGRHPRIDRIDRAALEKEWRAVPTISKNKKAFIEFVCCGSPIPDHEIRVVDENTGEPVNERIVGQLQFSGPSAMQGYYHNINATQAIYHDGWWDTGDYAYLADGEVFITGRKKDIIIKGGRNLYPDAAEEIVGNLTHVRKGCVVAFGVSDVNTGTEKFIIVAETLDILPLEKKHLINEINEKIIAVLGIPPDQIILAPKGTVLKTSSGKLQRSACKQAYLDGKLTHRRLPISMQISKLLLRSIVKKSWEGISYLGRILYNSYIGVLIIILLPLVLLSLYIFSRNIASKICRTTARLLFRLIACPITIINNKNLTKFTPMVFIANHASYIDSVLLTAVLPTNSIFVGKKELLSMPVIKIFFKKLGHVSVDRLDFMQSLSDSEHLTDVLKQKNSIIIFPEGTFTYATGLRPFKYGAFKLSVDTATPVCPIAIQGTRLILRDGSYLLKRGNIIITVSEPIFPKEKGWHEIVRLCAASREEISKYCGEQAIDLITAGPKR